MKFNIFNFKIGKEKRPFSYYVKTSLFLNIPIDLISYLPGITRRNAFNFIDKLQQKFNIDSLNDYIIKDTQFLNYRIDRVVQEAIDKYEN